LPRLIGDIVRLEEETAIIAFRSVNQQAVITLKDFKHLEQYLVPGIRVVLTTENNKLEIPIVKWQENNKIKLLMYT